MHLNLSPIPCPWKNCLPWNPSLVSKRLGTTALEDSGTTREDTWILELPHRVQLQKCSAWLNQLYGYDREAEGGNKRREGRQGREIDLFQGNNREINRSISTWLKAFYFAVFYSGIFPTLTNTSLFLRPGFQAFSGYQWANILVINYPYNIKYLKWAIGNQKNLIRTGVWENRTTKNLGQTPWKLALNLHLLK